MRCPWAGLNENFVDTVSGITKGEVAGVGNDAFAGGDLSISFLDLLEGTLPQLPTAVDTPEICPLLECESGDSECKKAMKRAIEGGKCSEQEDKQDREMCKQLCREAKESLCAELSGAEQKKCMWDTWETIH